MKMKTSGINRLQSELSKLAQSNRQNKMNIVLLYQNENWTLKWNGWQGMLWPQRYTKTQYSPQQSRHMATQSQPLSIKQLVQHGFYNPHSIPITIDDEGHSYTYRCSIATRFSIIGATVKVSNHQFKPIFFNTYGGLSIIHAHNELKKSVKSKIENYYKDIVLDFNLATEYPPTRSITNTVLDPINQIGVSNIGNTCYMNSVIHMLYNRVDFRFIVMVLAQDLGPQFAALSQIFTGLFTRNEDMANDRQSLNILGQLKQYGKRQRDPYAFFLDLMNSIPRQSTYKTAINELFNVVECRQEVEFRCKIHKPEKYRLQTTFSAQVLLKHNQTIQQYLKRSEFPSECECGQPYTLITKVVKSSKYLILHINSKVQTFEWCIRVQERDYGLRGIVLHWGTSLSGHIVYAERHQGGWTLYNDSRVKTNISQSQLRSYGNVVIMVYENQQMGIQQLEKVIPKQKITLLKEKLGKMEGKNNTSWWNKVMEPFRNWLTFFCHILDDRS